MKGKYFISILIVLIIAWDYLTLPIEAKSYNIETSQGIEVIEVPNDKSLEQAYCELASLYYEETYAKKELEKDLASVIFNITQVLNSSRSLNTCYTKGIEKVGSSKSALKLDDRAVIKGTLKGGIVYDRLQNKVLPLFTTGLIVYEFFSVEFIYLYPTTFGAIIGFEI